MRNLLSGIALWTRSQDFRPEFFHRQDESADERFYSQERIVEHIDKPAIAATVTYYRQSILDIALGNILSGRAENTGDTKIFRILDLCSSWISHLPTDLEKEGIALEVTGLGMNQKELDLNQVLDRRVRQNLNVNPILPFPAESFDLVLNSVSVDYLTRPLEVFPEIKRVLRPGGRSVNVFSNRFFPTKVIDFWLRSDDLSHCKLAGSYFAATSEATSSNGSSWTDIAAYDISPNPGQSDPLFAVQATKDVLKKRDDEL
ncbi:unnamed protein product [Amoebophrya sp. A25]|nr:unnamed protein product [Amoebophrya sp. A25]|eukprot:GSA25T00014590001.1